MALGKIILRGREHPMTPYDFYFVAGQRKEHSVFSADGHDWDVSNDGQTRHCKRCFLIQCCPPEWVTVPHSHFFDRGHKPFRVW